MRGTILDDALANTYFREMINLNLRRLLAAASVTATVVVVGPMNIAQAGDQPGPATQSVDAKPLTPTAELKQIKQITDPQQELLYTAQPLIQHVLDKYPSVDGGLVWIPNGPRIQIGIAGSLSEPSADATEAMGELNALDIPVEISFISRPRSQPDLLQEAIALVNDREHTGKGLSEFYGAIPDLENGAVTVSVGAQDASSWRVALAKKYDNVVVEVIPAPVDQTASRISDFAPWAGGDWLSFSASTQGFQPAACTGGFTWKMWGTGLLRGSTSEHCVNPSGHPSQHYWYNAGVLWGTVALTSKHVDTALFDSTPAGQYSATVWVGTPATTVLRPVKAAAAADVVGESVALSGANSGLNVGTVYAINYIEPNNPQNLHLTVLSEFFSDGGDSGGPWLQTFTDGSVRAKGVHHGFLRINGLDRMLYAPVNNVSAAMSASIAVVP